MKVRVGSYYSYTAAGIDTWDARTNLTAGTIVKVINRRNAPPANTMGQCYVELDGKFIGMVSTQSLTPATPTKKKESKVSYNKFYAAVKADASYNETNKQAFHAESKKMLRALAKELGLKAGQYDVRSNMGGIAVSGEITLHSDTLYVQFSQSGLTGERFMWRRCNGRKDYTGGQNQWMPWVELQSLAVVASKMK